jgi:hypothetical protein
MKRERFRYILFTLLGGVMGVAATLLYNAGRPMPVATIVPQASKVGGGMATQQEKADGSSKPAGDKAKIEDPLAPSPKRAQRFVERDHRLIVWFKETYGPVYDKVFADYGIDPSTRELLMESIASVYRAKLEVRKVTTQMMDEQWGHRDMMKKILGPRYDEYLKYEERWPIREEVGFIAEYAGKSGSPLSGDRLEILQQLVERNGTLGWKPLGSLGGALGGVPEQTYGTENVISLLEQRQASLALQSTATIEQARASGFSPKEIELLESYYRGQLQYYDDAIEKSQPSSPKKIARLEQKLANLRQNPSANANEIRATTAMLDWMRSNPGIRANN